MKKASDKNLAVPVPVTLSLTPQMQQSMQALADENKVEFDTYITQLLGQALATELLRRELVKGSPLDVVLTGNPSATK